MRFVASSCLLLAVVVTPASALARLGPSTAVNLHPIADLSAPLQTIARAVSARVASNAQLPESAADSSPRRVGGEIRPPAKTKTANADYPADARAKGIEGQVGVDVTIDQRGKVVDVKVIESIPSLDDAAVAAVRQWEFRPTVLNGTPISVIMSTAVVFRTSQPHGSGTSLIDAIRNLERYNAARPPASQQADNEPSITFDAKGVDVTPWVRRFVAQVRRNWFVPMRSANTTGRVVITFVVRKDGRIEDIKIKQGTDANSLNVAARDAIATSSPTEPLPREYPDKELTFTVTFYYNEPKPAPAASPQP